MPSITILNHGDGVKRRLHVPAAKHGHSMKEQAGWVPNAALVEQPTRPPSMTAVIHVRFVPMGDVDLETPPRDPIREPLRLGLDCSRCSYD